MKKPTAEILKTEEQKKNANQGFTMQQIREIKTKFQEFTDNKYSVGIGLDTSVVPYKQNIIVSYEVGTEKAVEATIDAFVVSETETFDEVEAMTKLFKLRQSFDIKKR